MKQKKINQSINQGVDKQGQYTRSSLFHCLRKQMIARRHRVNPILEMKLTSNSGMEFELINLEFELKFATKNLIPKYICHLIFLEIFLP